MCGCVCVCVRMQQVQIPAGASWKRSLRQAARLCSAFGHTIALRSKLYTFHNWFLFFSSASPPSSAAHLSIGAAAYRCGRQCCPAALLSPDYRLSLPADRVARFLKIPSAFEPRNGACCCVSVWGTGNFRYSVQKLRSKGSGLAFCVR